MRCLLWQHLMRPSILQSLRYPTVSGTSGLDTQSYFDNQACSCIRKGQENANGCACEQQGCEKERPSSGVRAANSMALRSIALSLESTSSMQCIQDVESPWQTAATRRGTTRLNIILKSLQDVMNTSYEQEMLDSNLNFWKFWLRLRDQLNLRFSFWGESRTPVFYSHLQLPVETLHNTQLCSRLSTRHASCFSSLL